MTREEIKQVVLQIFEQIVNENEKSYDVTIDENTPIMGSQSPFDSVDLVNFIVTLEQKLEDDFGISVILADDRAMGQTVSPYKSIGTITDYIELLISENK
jgi:acyl carrier protein